VTAWALYWLLLRAVLLSFSGFATVPILRDALVLDHHVLTDAQLNDAIAISQASPGPLGMYVVIVGYFVAGFPGALAGASALMTPPLLAIPIARLVLRHQSAALQGACRGIVIASCGLMGATGLGLAAQAAPTAWHLAILLAGFAVVACTTVKPVWVIVVAAIAGAVMG
jgi:chromate transporter